MLTDISPANQQALNKLITEGWEIMLHYGNHESYSTTKGLTWEVDITRQLPKGRWDNHQDGYSTDINVAIQLAVMNITEGKRLNPKRGNESSQ